MNIDGFANTPTYKHTHALIHKYTGISRTYFHMDRDTYSRDEGSKACSNDTTMLRGCWGCCQSVYEGVAGGSRRRKHVHVVLRTNWNFKNARSLYFIKKTDENSISICELQIERDLFYVGFENLNFS